MKAIELETVVSADGLLNVQIPGIKPGRHHLVLVIDEATPSRAQRALLEMEPLAAAPVPEGAAFRREEIYENGGR